MLAAITIGNRQGIPREAWARYARTGTSHLMAISGLHIGLAGGGAFAVAWCLLSVVARDRDIRRAALGVSLPFAIAYALLSGFAVPAQRAVLMLIAAGLCLSLRRPADGGRQLALVCTSCVLADPVVIWQPGFVLSFTAVALLIWRAMPLRQSLADAPCHVRLRLLATELWGLQLGLLFGLFALTALLFDRASLVAPLVNMIVLPVFSLVVVPFSLLGLLFDGPAAWLGDGFLRISYASVRLVLGIVEVAAGLPAAKVPVDGQLSLLLLAAGLVGAATILPVLWPGRRLAWVALVAACGLRAPPAPDGCADLYVLDVGQGSSAVIRTHSHTLVFDAGPAFRSGSDAASFVLLPFLDGLGVDTVDLLVISHADLDHAGGTRSLVDGKTVRNIIAGEPAEGAPAGAAQCHDGQSWQFDDLEIEILHPRAGAAWAGNNASCIVLARIGAYSVVLPGDVESSVENLLADSLPRVTTVLVPHHGSMTSSSPLLVEALRPSLAIVSAGYGNRWGMPRPEVVDRWRQWQSACQHRR